MVNIAQLLYARLSHVNNSRVHTQLRFGANVIENTDVSRRSSLRKQPYFFTHNCTHSLTPQLLSATCLTQHSERHTIAAAHRPAGHLLRRLVLCCLHFQSQQNDIAMTCMPFGLERHHGSPTGDCTARCCFEERRMLSKMYAKRQFVSQTCAQFALEACSCWSCGEQSQESHQRCRHKLQMGLVLHVETKWRAHCELHSTETHSLGVEDQT